MIDILFMLEYCFDDLVPVPSFWFLRSGSFVPVPAFWFLRSGSFVPVPAFWFLRSGSCVAVTAFPGARRLTRGSRVSVVSLVVPGFPSSDSWFPGARRLTRGSWAPVVSLVVPRIPSSHSWFRIPAHFFVKNFRKIRKINFSDSRDQNKITKFLWFFYMSKNFEKNLHFCFQNGFLTSNSDSWPNLGGGSTNSHQIRAYGSNFRSGRPPGLPFFDQYFLDFSILALLKAKFDKPDR